MRRIAMFVMAAVVAGGLVPGVAADEASSVSGQLTVDGETISPSSAVAVWTVSTGWNAGERQLEIVMAPGPVSSDGAERALEPKDAVRRSVDGDLVEVTLGADGSLQMVYAYLVEGSRNYGFGSGGEAEVTIADGRVSGRVYTEGEESIGDTPISFDLKFDLPILPERAPGTALEAGGGDAGAAYLALIAAQHAGDVETLKKHGDAAMADNLANLDPEYGGWMLDSIKEMANQDMEVTGGEQFDGWAILTVTGKDWSGDKVEGQVKMEKNGEHWRLAEESLSVIWE